VTRFRDGRQTGFSLLELVIVIVIVALLAALAMDRLLFYEEMAEKAAMEYTASSVRSAVRVQVADMMIHGRLQELPKLAETNPIGFLEDRPANYRGEFSPVKYDASLDGRWYYNPGSKELVYQLNRGAHFESGDGGRKEVRYRIGVTYGLRDGGAKVAESAKLELARPYRWLESR
jgi:prepilin-type N-terminal cleavage/methylation domain-containing protein